MSENTIQIVNAKKSDFAQIQAIYSHYVNNTTITLDEFVPSVEALITQFDLVKSYDLPYLVAKHGDTVLGYSYAVQYRPRSAYRFCVEQSIYLHPDYLGQGIGRRLIEKLLKRCETKGIRQVIAVITRTDNIASERLHQNFGFQEVGVLGTIAFKFGQWIDTVVLQKSLGDGNHSEPKERRKV